MTPMLVSCFFSAKKERDGQYDRLARVLAYTARQHCPGWVVQITQIAPTLIAPATGNPSHSWNSAKLDYWDAVVQAAPNGTPLLLMDADTIILRPLDPIWDRSFDLAYTARERSRLPLNGGVVALRVSDQTKAAIRRWQQLNAAMLTNGPLHQPWHRKYAGMNQASFGCLLEEGGLADLSVVKLPCAEWNCCEWAAFTPATRVVHIKSRLRRSVFGPTRGASDLTDLVTRWRAVEAQVNLVEGRQARSARFVRREGISA